MADSDGAGDKYTRPFARRKFEESKADSEANTRWLSAYSQEDLDFVNSHLTEELMQALDLHMVRSVSEAPGAAPAAVKAAALVAAPASGAPEPAGGSRARRDLGIGLGRHPRLERGLGGVPGFGLVYARVTNTSSESKLSAPVIARDEPAVAARASWRHRFTPRRTRGFTLRFDALKYASRARRGRGRAGAHPRAVTPAHATPHRRYRMGVTFGKG
eukprot:scaffold28249_cov57-Phaeocystis_antarctica.AAC.1